MVDNLDWSVATGYERGTLPAALCHEAANAGPAARATLQALSSFFHALPFVSMTPDTSWIMPAEPKVLPPGSIQALLVNGSSLRAGVFAAAFLGTAGIRTLSLYLPDSHRCAASSVIAEWFETRRVGPVIARTVVPPPAAGSQERSLEVLRSYNEDVAFRLVCGESGET